MEKSAQELRNEYKALQDKITGHKARIWERLLTLAARHPDAIIGTFNDEPLKAKFVFTFSVIVKSFDVEQHLSFIQKIEDWLKEQNPSKQLKMF